MEEEVKVQVQNVDRKSTQVRLRAENSLVILIDNYASRKGISRSKTWREAAKKGILLMLNDEKVIQ